jgi:hypothetical protein
MFDSRTWKRGSARKAKTNVGSLSIPSKSTCRPRRTATIARLREGEAMNTAGLIRLILLLVIVCGLIWYLLYGMAS